MAWLLAPVYDRMVRVAEDAGLRAWRTELLAPLSGRVLEIGAGTGADLGLHPPAVEELILTEPDPGMRKRLEAKLADLRASGASLPAEVTVRPDPAHALDEPADSVDAVVAALVLCTVPDPAAALAEVRRVLKPGGRLVFLEHVAAHDRPDRLRWQRRLDPIWRRVGGGCRLIRDTERSILDAGFRLESITRESARKMPTVIRGTIRGVALAPTET